MGSLCVAQAGLHFPILLAFLVLVPHSWIIKVSQAPEECGPMGRDWPRSEVLVPTSCDSLFPSAAHGKHLCSSKPHTWSWGWRRSRLHGKGEGGLEVITGDQEAEQAEAV